MSQALQSEPTPPSALAPLQRAFGQAMATPFAFEPEAEQVFRQQPELYPEDIVAEMLDHPTLAIDGRLRLTSYNRQYWFRLLNILQQEYPLLLALLGLRDFNHLAMSYLTCHPPHSPSLRDLSNDLGRFLAGSCPWNQPQLRQAAALEYAFIVSFDAAELPRLDPTLLAEHDLLELPLKLQPHVQLFREDWDLVLWRGRAKSTTAPEDLGAVPLPQSGTWIIYRGSAGTAVEPLPAEAFALLEELARGQSVSAAIETVCTQETQASAVLDAHLGDWFQHWIAAGIFAHPDEG